MSSPVFAPADGRIALSLHDMLGPVQPLPRTPPSEEENGTGPKKSFQPYHSQSVPKSQVLTDKSVDHALSGKPVTTMMLRNIPNKYTQNSLLQEIDDMGFVGTYNFFYLPMDVHNRSNVGYAFINFALPSDAERFRRIFSEHRFQRFQSRKISSVCTAHVQGLEENLLHFDNKAVTHARNDQYRPIVLWNKQRMEFEDAVAAAKARLSGVSPQQSRSKAGLGVGMAQPTPASVGSSVTTPTAAPASTDARLGLENAIRDLLHTRASPSLGPAPDPTAPLDMHIHAPPPGLQQASPPYNNDIVQLLSLRSLLVDRLHEKEPELRREGPAQMTSPLYAPAYVPLPGSSQMPESGENSLLGYDWNKAGHGSPPRANSMHFGNMIDQFSAERNLVPWCTA